MKGIAFFAQIMVTVFVFPIYVLAALLKAVGNTIKDLLEVIYTIINLAIGSMAFLMCMHALTLAGGNHFFKVLLKLIFSFVIAAIITALAFYIQAYLMYFTEIVISIILWLPGKILNLSHRISDKCIGKISMKAERMAGGIN